jgi:mercuric ion transport protein
MQDKTLFRTGITGSVIAAICCATPVLAVVLAAVGLSAWIGWTDYVVWPALAFFLGLTAWVLWRRRKATAADETTTQSTTRP